MVCLRVYDSSLVRRVKNSCIWAFICSSIYLFYFSNGEKSFYEVLSCDNIQFFQTDNKEYEKSKFLKANIFIGIIVIVIIISGKFHQSLLLKSVVRETLPRPLHPLRRVGLW
jgi:hypothetical protein